MLVFLLGLISLTTRVRFPPLEPICKTGAEAGSLLRRDSARNDLATRGKPQIGRRSAAR